MRNCDHSNCRQGRACQIERDTPAAAAFAFIISAVAIAFPVAFMLLRGHHA